MTFSTFSGLMYNNPIEEWNLWIWFCTVKRFHVSLLMLPNLLSHGFNIADMPFDDNDLSAILFHVDTTACLDPPVHNGSVHNYIAANLDSSM